MSPETVPGHPGLIIDCGGKADPNPFLKYAETRWLARYPVLVRIVKNWEALKFYFNKEESHGKRKRKVIKKIFKRGFDLIQSDQSIKKCFIKK